MRFSWIVLLTLVFSFSMTYAQEGITLAVGEETGAVGETVCVPVTASNFSGILSTQYTLQWDARYLEFATITNFGLPWLSGSNFGDQKAADGLLTVVWIDNALRGVDRTSDQVLFEICFKVKAGRGQKAYIGFAEEPTPFEVVNLAEEVILLNPVAGGIVVK